MPFPAALACVFRSSHLKHRSTEPPGRAKTGKPPMEKIDQFVNDLQERIFDEAREAYGKRGFERWRNPRYNGRMASADSFARVTGDCGDSIEIYLKIENNRVKDASYVTDGCGTSNICGSFAAELAIRRDLEAVTDINGEAVLNAIGGLPDNDRHCADLAAAALQEALSQYMQGLVSGERTPPDPIRQETADKTARTPGGTSTTATPGCRRHFMSG
jgi:nitrogen fixation NifU-like protein